MNYNSTFGAMRAVLCTLLVCVSLMASGQILKSSKARVSFSSEAPMEIIKASSNKLVGLIKPETNTFAFQVAVISFQGFNSDLQREHFNENYMESTKYPKIKFVGKINGPVDFKKDGEYAIKAKGKINVHGIEKDREIPVKVVVAGGMVSVKSEFEVALADHNIKIPTIVNQKLAKVITCKVTAQMAPK